MGQQVLGGVLGQWEHESGWSTASEEHATGLEEAGPYTRQGHSLMVDQPSRIHQEAEINCPASREGAGPRTYW